MGLKKIKAGQGFNSHLEHSLPFSCRLGPREILRDRVDHHLLEERSGEDLGGTRHGGSDSVCILSLKPIGVKGTHMESSDSLLDSVNEASSGGDERDGPVLHGVELDEAAWLETRGDHDVVGSSSHQMCKGG